MSVFSLCDSDWCSVRYYPVRSDACTRRFAATDIAALHSRFSVGFGYALGDLRLCVYYRDFRDASHEEHFTVTIENHTSNKSLQATATGPSVLT